MFRPSPRVRNALILAAICTATVCRPAAAQNASAPTSVDFAYSVNSFAYTDSTSLVEFTYQFAERGITYSEYEDGVAGRLLVRIDLRDTAGRLVHQSQWVTTNPKPADSAANRALVGIKLFEIPPGTYRATVSYMDVAAPERTDSVVAALSVRDYASDRLQLSDVEIVSQLQPSSDERNPFYKNGMIVYPNPSATVAPPILLLNSYIEVYNADRVPGGTYHVEYSLADSTGRIFYQKGYDRDRPDASAVVETNSIVLERLRSGSYYLVVKAFDGPRHSFSDSAVVIKPIVVINPQRDSAITAAVTQPQNPGALGVIDPTYSGLTAEELDVEYKKVWPIATGTERDRWDNLGDDAAAKARFLTQFWKDRDDDPVTPDNPTRDAYYARVSTAEHRFAAPMFPRGWDSPRGRVLLEYGRPDNIDRHPSDFNRRPYEIWTYQATGYEFVFVDRSQTGTYLLVHSTAPHEPRMENWMTEYAMIDEHMED